MLRKLITLFNLLTIRRRTFRTMEATRIVMMFGSIVVGGEFSQEDTTEGLRR